MASARELEAEDYLREHKITELVNNLTSLLLFHRPDHSFTTAHTILFGSYTPPFAERPREFLIMQLEKLKLARLADVDYPCLFDESNVDAVFGILDPSGQGYITRTQYIESLKTLGVDVTNLPAPPEKITLEVFKYDMRIHLKKSCSTFKA